jgi:hypothetical protein
MRELDRRLNRIETTLARLESPVPPAETVAHREPETSPYITHKEVTEILEQTEKRMAGHIAQQFSHHMLAIDSLRAMIVDTDVLLERVLKGLDSASRDVEQHGEPFEADEPPIAREVARENPGGTNPVRENPTGSGKRPVSTSVG